MNLNNTSSKTLWIGEIDSWMDEKFLIKIFSDYANVRNIKVIRDKITGAHQGYGFVEFESCDVAAYILQNCNGKLIPNSNKTFKLNWATFSAGKMQALLGPNSNSQEYTIYVCDLDINVSEEMLKEIFEKIYPSVISSKLIVDPITKVSKGYGFVKFNDFNESQKAIIEMNGKYIFSKPIKTNQAVWKKYNPESSKNNSSGGMHKSYHNNYYKHNNNNVNYINQQSYYYNQYNNNSNYNYSNNNQSHNFTTTTSTNNNNTMNQPQSQSQPQQQQSSQQQPVTQNINIYLQSLYQQHYLNNVYFNQFYTGNNNLSQQFSNLSLDNSSDINNGEDNLKESLNNESFLQQSSNIEAGVNNAEGN